MDAAGALLVDGNAEPADVDLTEELTWLLLRERKPQYQPLTRWPEGDRTRLICVILAACMKWKWKAAHDVLWLSMSRALAIADLYYRGGGSDIVALRPDALARWTAGRESLHGIQSIISITEAAYAFWWIAIKVEMNDERALYPGSCRTVYAGPEGAAAKLPTYTFLSNWLKEEHGCDIGIDLMKAFEWKVCTRVDWNLRMPTMHDFLNVHLQRPWTKYDLDASMNTPTGETLVLLKHWVDYTSVVLMMDPLDMMLQYHPSQCAAAVMLIARVLSLITPRWIPELTTQTLGADDEHNNLLWREQWFVCVHEMAILVASSLEQCNDEHYVYQGVTETKMNVGLQLNRLEQWLEFNSLDAADVDVQELVMAEENFHELLIAKESGTTVAEEDVEPASKKPKVNREPRRSILARKKVKYVHGDKKLAAIVQETCGTLLAVKYEVWSR